MDTAENITFTSKLTFWDKFKCFYVLALYSLFSLYNTKKWRPYNLICKDEQFLKVNQNWV